MAILPGNPDDLVTGEVSNEIRRFRKRSEDGWGGRRRNTAIHRIGYPRHAGCVRTRRATGPDPVIAIVRHEEDHMKRSLLAVLAPLCVFTACSKHSRAPASETSSSTDVSMFYQPPRNTPFDAAPEKQAEYLRAHRLAWDDGVLGVSVAGLREETAQGVVHSKANSPPTGASEVFLAGWSDGKYDAAMKLLNPLFEAGKTDQSVLERFRTYQDQVRKAENQPKT